MSKTRAKTNAATSSRQRRRRTVSGSRKAAREHAYVVENGRPAFVLVPVGEYEHLVKTDMAKAAVARLGRQDVDWSDADALRLELAGERIAQARKAAGLTQKQLGDRLKLPQSQISRIERNPDHTTVRTLKRIARALGVDVGALV